jgi:voltage-gated potassium channel
MVRKRTFYLIFLIIISVLVYSSIFMFLGRLEGYDYTFIDSLYWVISTITTVGYGDIVLYSKIGRVFSIIVELTGIAYLFGVGVPFIVIPWVEKKFRLTLPTSYDGENHMVICGYSELVRELISDLSFYRVDYVVMVDDRDTAVNLLEKNINCVLGDFSAESFSKINANKARYIILAFKEERKNAEILLTLGDIKVPKMAIVEDPTYGKYFTYAGADRVVSAKGLLGIYLAKKALDPITGKLSSAIKVMGDLKLMEIFVKESSEFVNRTLKEARIRDKTGCNVVGLWKDGELIINPSSDEYIKKNSVLLVTGTDNQLRKLQEIAMGGT